MNSKIRVVYVPRHDFTTIFGGDYYYLLQIMKHLRPMGVDIEVVPVDQLSPNNGGDVLHLTQIYQLDTAEFALNWALKHRMQVVISPLFEEMLSLEYRQVSINRQKWRLLTEILGPGLAEEVYVRWQMARRSSSKQWQRQRDLLLASHVVTNTNYEYEHVRQYFKLGDHSHYLVRLGINGDLYRSWSPDSGIDLPQNIRNSVGQYILQVGLISSRKNQTGLLAALQQSEAPIVFVGKESPYEAKYYANLKQMANSRGNVYFLDWVENETLLSLYGNALMHVLPSWSERPGLVSLEAAACGCRVVSSNRAPLHEYLGDRAWYVDPADKRSMRDTVELVARSRPPVDLREYVLANFRWEDSARMQRQVYVDILSKHV